MKKKHTWFYLLPFMGTLLFWVACEQLTPIARVGNYVIYLQDLKEEVEKSRGASDRVLNIPSHVNGLVENKLKLCDAYNSGFKQDSIVLQRVKDFEPREIYSYIIEKEIIGNVIKERMIREQYSQRAKEWHVRHIFLPLTKDSVETKETLNILRKRVLKGEDFGILARQYSKDSQSAGKNGDLGYINWDNKDWGGDILKSASRLSVGHVSKVVKSDKGFHLVKLEQVRKVSLPPYEKEKDQIRQSLMRENRAKLDSMYFRFRDKIEDQYQGKILEDNIDSLLSLISIIEEKNKADKVNLRRDPSQFLKALNLDERNFHLAEYKGGAYTFENLLTTYEKISPMRRPALDNKAAVLEFLDRNVPRVLIIHHGYQKAINRKSAVKKAVVDEWENAMIRRVERVKIDQNTEIPEQVLLDYYNQNLHLYEKDVKVNLQEIVISDSLEAARIYARALAGEDFNTLAKNYNERLDTKVNNGILGFITRNDMGAIGTEAVKLKKGEISEPIKSENRYSIVKILDRQAGELRPFEDVRLNIRREKRNQLRNQLQKEWMDSLKKNYSVSIYSAVINREFGMANE